MGKIIIEKNTGGLNRKEASRDSVSGLLSHGVAVAEKLKLGVAYRLISLKDAESKGIDADYDRAHKVAVFHHIAEFFRVHPQGELYIYLQDKAVGYAQLIRQVEVFLRQAAGEVRQLAIAYHGTEPIVPAEKVSAKETEATEEPVAKPLTWSYLAGLAQEQYERLYALYMPCQIVLEGTGFVYEHVAELPNARAFNAPNVSIVLLEKGLGTVLGAISKAQVNQSIGWVERFNIYGKALERPALIDGTLLTNITGGDLLTLETKGYILPKVYIGKAGVYLSSGATCTDSQHDFAYLEYGRTFDKAVRGLYIALVPCIEKDFGIDPLTKKIAPQDIKMMELTAAKYLEQMQREGEISYYQVTIDPTQDILAEEKLTLQISLTPRGVARTIVAQVGFKSNK